LLLSQHILPISKSKRSGLFFKLEEEEKPALLLLLPKVRAETAVFGSAVGLGCWLVVAIAQAVHLLVEAFSTSTTEGYA
jgi:hypothetical protein